MWYELYLRAKAGDAARTDALWTALRQDPAVSHDDRAGWQAQVPDGSLALEVRQPAPVGVPLPDPPLVEGVDVRLPASASAALAGQACDLVFRWAEEHGLQVYDPQLGRSVTERDREAICARVERLATYLTETVGLDDGATGRYLDVDPPRQPLSLRTKFYLGLATVLVLLALIVRYC